MILKLSHWKTIVNLSKVCNKNLYYDGWSPFNRIIFVLSIWAENNIFLFPLTLPTHWKCPWPQKNVHDLKMDFLFLLLPKFTVAVRGVFCTILWISIAKLFWAILKKFSLFWYLSHISKFFFALSEIKKQIHRPTLPFITRSGKGKQK